MKALWVALLFLHMEVYADAPRIYVHYGAARHRMMLQPDETVTDFLGRVCERLNIEVALLMMRSPR